MDMPPPEEMMGMPPMQQLGFKENLGNTLYFLRYFKPVTGIVVLLVFINIVSAGSLIPLMDFGRILGDYFGKRESVVWSFLSLFSSPENILYQYIVLAALLIVVSSSITLLANYLSSYIREFLLLHVRRDIYASLERLNIQSVTERGPGEYVQGIHRDVYSIDQLFNDLFSRTMPQLIFAGVAFAVLMNINPTMTLILSLAGFVLFPIFTVCNFKVNSLSQFVRFVFTEASDMLIETIGGFRDIMASGRFSAFAERFERNLVNARRSGIMIAWWSQVGGISTTFLTSLCSAAPIFVVIPKLLDAQRAGHPEQVTALIGATISYVLFLQHFLQIYSVMYQFFQQVAMSSPSFQQVRIMLTEDSSRKAAEQQRIEGAAGLSPVSRIEFEKVGMAYYDRPVLSDITFTIPGGKITAIVGQSGSGKTTIFNLLLRLLDPTQGMIRVNDRPLPTIMDKDLKTLIGLIPQDPFLFNTSLRENLLIAARHEPSKEQMQRALVISQLDEMVQAREGGLEFVAGHMGRNLSAGEKQRIALARLVLQDPEIIICDEYTANIDVKLAGRIHEAMRTEFAGRTRVIITHQLFAIKGADHIVVLDQGRVVQAGSHEELVAQPGVYHDLWNMQKLS